MIAPTTEQQAAAQRVASKLDGSCSIFTDAIIAEEPSLQGVEDVIVWVETYGEIFLCDGCGWWCGNEEMRVDANGERTCGDCTEDKGDD